MDYKTQQLIAGIGYHGVREIASLTKIMTCFVCLDLIERGIISEDSTVEISRRAADMIGTSANLEEGDIVNIWDLLHGLMLPSGNDAARALAEFCGAKIKP